MRNLALLLFFSLLAAPLPAQEITFTATLDRQSVAVGEHARLTITLSNSRENFSSPQLGGLMVVSGPFESSNFSYINGRMSSTVTRTWVITGMQPGNYTIGPASLRVGNAVIQTDPLTLEVTKGSAKPPDPAVARGQQQDPNLFVTINLSKNKGYVGEQIVATYTLYSRYSSIELSKYELPKLNGFWSEEIDLGNANWDDKPAVINGVQYRVAVLKKQLLFPQRGGKLRIEPLQLTGVVNRSFFSRGSSIEVTSNAVEFTAQELPPGAPNGFSGAVGELQMTVQVGRTEITADEAIDLQVRISGRANLKLLDAPAIDFPGEFEVYDPKINDRISISGNGMSGHREFQYLVIPRHEGTYTLAPIRFSYFDTRTGGYKNLESEAFTFEVAPGLASPAPGRATVNSGDVKLLERDIRFIRTGDLDLRPKGEFLFGSVRWFAGMVTPAFAFLLFLGWYRRHEARQADTLGTRRKKADRVARRHLQEASAALQRNDREAFYAALSRALNGYLADKFAMGVAEVNNAAVRARLAHLSGGDALADSYVRLVTACDMARFAPVEDKPRETLYEEAVELIGNIERNLRNR
jgi:hypothetical protein